MWFLLIKIFLLLLLAALFGAWLANWWFKRHYQDVTDEYIEGPAQDFSLPTGLLTKFDFDTGIAGLGAPDLSPMEARLYQLEQNIAAIDIPQPDLSPLQSRLDDMENAIASIRIPETDFSPVEARLFSMENMLSTPAPEQNNDALEMRLSTIEEALSSLNTRAAGLRNTDTGRLERQLDVIASAMAERGQPDMSGFEARLAGVEDVVTSLHIPDIDLGPIHSGLTRLEMSLANLDIPETDFSAVESRIHAMHESLSENRTLDINENDALHKRLINLSTAVSDLRKTDFTPLDQRLDDIEMRIAHINIPAPDLRSIDDGLGMVHNRMANLESRLKEDTLNKGDIALIQQRLDQVYGEVAQLEPMKKDLSRLDQIQGDLSRLDQIQSELSRLDHIQGEVARLEHIQLELGRLDRMEGKLSALRGDVADAAADLDPLEQRIINLQTEISNQPETDLTPVLSSVYAMEQRMDFGAIENRLTSIEYGLAALHHMLRSRQAQQADMGQRALERTPEPATPPPAPEAQPYRRQATRPDRDTERDQDRDTERERERDRERERARERDSDRLRDRDTGRDYYRPPQAAQTYAPPPQRDPWPDEMPMPRPFDVPDMPDRSGYDYETAPMPDPAPRQAPMAPRDEIRAARRPDDKANLLTRPAFGAPDDLEEISGVGPMLHGLLTEIGVFYFWQVAEWGPREIDWVDDMLDGFNGRIKRDDWVGQAKILATGKHAARRPLS